MYQLTSQVYIGEFGFRFIVDFEMESSWELLTDTAKITLPSKVNWKGKSLVKLIKVGDRIKIYLGYGNDLKKVFQGYVVKVQPKTPLVLECQDVMYNLKKNSQTKAYAKVNLKTLLGDIANGVPFQAVDVNLGMLRFTNKSTAEILKKISEDYGLKSWCRNGTLYSGLAYLPELQTKHKVVFQEVVIKDNLFYTQKADIKLKVKAISILPNNQKIEVELGDAEGEQRTLHYYNLSEVDLKKRAELEMDRLKYEGYRGDFETFGFSNINHGDIIELIDNKHPERQGHYLVKKVKVHFGKNGYRQNVHLERKI